MLNFLSRLADGLAVLLVLLMACIDIDHSTFGVSQMVITIGAVSFIGWRIYINRQYLFR